MTARSSRSRSAAAREVGAAIFLQPVAGLSMVADDHADPHAGSDREERLYPRGAAQKMVADFAAETGIAMVPQRAMGYPPKTAVSPCVRRSPPTKSPGRPIGS